MGDERRYIIQHGEHQHDLQGGELRQLLQNRKQQVACGGVQPDERIVHDEDAGSRKQCFGQLKLTEFATGEENDSLIEHRFDTEKVE